MEESAKVAPPDSAEATTDGASGDSELGPYFQKARRKVIRRKPLGPTPAAAEAASASEGEDMEHQPSTSTSSATSSDADDLGDLFAKTKRKPRIKPASQGYPPPASAARFPMPGLPPAEKNEVGDEDDLSSAAARSAASRAAWKRRATASPEEQKSLSRAASGGSSPSSLKGGMGEVPGRSFGDTVKSMAYSQPFQAKTGMYRAVGRYAVDSTRCHWLIKPDSLINRLEPAAGEFLQRQWLALAQIGSKDGGTQAAEHREDRKRSYPKRLFAGWLAQSLRPKGWLAIIPEEEQRNLPMPEVPIAEPDRWLKRPPTAFVAKVVLTPLGRSSPD